MVLKQCSKIGWNYGKNTTKILNIWKNVFIFAENKILYFYFGLIITSLYTLYKWIKALRDGESLLREIIVDLDK